MTARWTAFGLWAVVAASLVYWALKLFVPGTPAPAHATLASTAATPRGDLTRVFGRDPVPEADDEPVPTARFHLLGVVAPRGAAGAREGVALIAVDDKPARAYRVGAVVDGDNVLQSVRARGASLGPRGGEAVLALEIPLPVPAATGTLPGAAVAAPVGRAGAPPGPPPGQALLPRSRLAPGFNPLQIGALPLPGQGAVAPMQDGEAGATDPPSSTR